MAISSTNRKAGPYLSDGEQLEYSFDFKVFTAQDLRIVTEDTNGAETDLVLDADYSVVLNEDQENDAGGTITLVESLTENHTLIITSNIELTQDLSLQNGGNFSPASINNALDKIVIQIQQVDEKASRAVKSPITGDDDPDEIVNALLQAKSEATAQAVIATEQAALAIETMSSDIQIKNWAYVQAFAITTATRNTQDVITTATIVWPDGATGTFTATTINATFDVIDAWTATHILSGVTKTVTQSAVTRNSNDAVTAQPVITIS
jgi:hypothetical protein